MEPATWEQPHLPDHSPGSGSFLNEFLSSNFVIENISIPDYAIKGVEHEEYASYTVEIDIAIQDSQTQRVKPRKICIYRRYKDFRWLSKYLRAELSSHIVPPIPSKEGVIGLINRGTHLEHRSNIRRFYLEKFLKRIVEDPILCKSNGFKIFVTSTDPPHMSVKVPPRMEHPSSKMSILISNLMGKFADSSPDVAEVKLGIQKLKGVVDDILSNQETLDFALDDAKYALASTFISLSELVSVSEQEIQSMTTGIGLEAHKYTTESDATHNFRLDILHELEDMVRYCESGEYVANYVDKVFSACKYLECHYHKASDRRDEALLMKPYGGIMGSLKGKLVSLAGYDIREVSKDHIIQSEIDMNEISNTLNLGRIEYNNALNNVNAEIPKLESTVIENIKDLFKKQCSLNVKHHTETAVLWDELIKKFESQACGFEFDTPKSPH